MTISIKMFQNNHAVMSLLEGLVHKWSFFRQQDGLGELVRIFQASVFCKNNAQRSYLDPDYIAGAEAQR